MWWLLVPFDLLPGDSPPIFALLAEHWMCDPEVIRNGDGVGG